MKKTFKARKWQKTAFKKTAKAIAGYKNNVVSLSAGVASGKTAVAADAMGKFIRDNIEETTVQMFVAPRISLCEQQAKEVEMFIEAMFGLVNGTDYQIHVINCNHKEYSKMNHHINGHNVFFFCDESLWGTDSKAKNPDGRWAGWMKKWRIWDREGVQFGVCFLDEAHNYNNKVEKIFHTED